MLVWKIWYSTKFPATFIKFRIEKSVLLLPRLNFRRAGGFERVGALPSQLPTLSS